MVGIPAVAQVREWVSSEFNLACIYHPNATAEGSREREQDIYNGIQPLYPPFVCTFISSLCFGSEYGDDGIGRVAGLQLGG